MRDIYDQCVYMFVPVRNIRLGINVSGSKLKPQQRAIILLLRVKKVQVGLESIFIGGCIGSFLRLH